ncbi:hypothetical protein, partial [Tumebacillus flagellatus]|uniref:hypothetical protein n=1 Tax=Tumebacillus flagellatus TaxID=1157490 RepID=UPI00056E8B6D
MSEETVVVGGNIVPLGSDYGGTPQFRPQKIDSGGRQYVAIDLDNTTGTAATGVNMMTGGAGKFGWISSIYSAVLSIGTTLSNV